ncbi:hypothetical protein CDAR_467601 [Caerostris darwini]|uniref:Uncharacterized protein n=1 Tax=Caerostris darwini TaxID=1538125 RepID=A0AAV4SPD6_9ARAC|nr:hypothetical protein CDAR_467601 [Caerostris darwini]
MNQKKRKLSFSIVSETIESSTFLERNGHLLQIISSFESPNEILRRSEDELPKDGVKSPKRLNLLPFLVKNGHLLQIIFFFERRNEIVRRGEDVLPKDGVMGTFSSPPSIVDVPFRMI